MGESRAGDAGWPARAPLVSPARDLPIRERSRQACEKERERGGGNKSAVEDIRAAPPGGLIFFGWY